MLDYWGTRGSGFKQTLESLHGQFRPWSGFDIMWICPCWKGNVHCQHSRAFLEYFAKEKQGKLQRLYLKRKPFSVLVRYYMRDFSGKPRSVAHLWRNRESYNAVISGRFRFSLYLKSLVSYSSPVRFQGLFFLPPKTPSYVRWIVVNITVCFSWHECGRSPDVA